jgi:predicted aspartyl protease
MENFTIELIYQPKSKELAIPVTLSGNGRKMVDCIGIIDTGATSTMISEQVAEELRLYPCGEISVSGVHGTNKSDLYFLDIVFGDFVLSNHRVSGSTGDAGFDILIGMDILSMGEFEFVRFGGRQIFLFGIPALSGSERLF